MTAVTADNTFYRPVGGDGRHIGVCGDIGAYLAGTGNLALVLEGKGVIATTRSPIHTVIASGSAAGSLTLTGAAVGDLVVSVIDTSSWTDVSADFESTISVVNKIQQLTGTSSHTVLILTRPQS
jgi:hypothetical protein